MNQRIDRQWAGSGGRATACESPHLADGKPTRHHTVVPGIDPRTDRRWLGIDHFEVADLSDTIHDLADLVGEPQADDIGAGLEVEVLDVQAPVAPPRLKDNRRTDGVGIGVYELRTVLVTDDDGDAAGAMYVRVDRQLELQWPALVWLEPHRVIEAGVSNSRVSSDPRPAARRR